jgi:cell surface protein SprA
LDNTDDSAKKDNISSRAIDYTKRMSINFIGVRNKEVLNKKTGLRSRKLYFSQSYNKVERHDFEIEDYVDQVSSSVDYAFSFQPKPIEPFKNTGFMKKTAIGNCSVILILIIF